MTRFFCLSGIGVVVLFTCFCIHLFFGVGSTPINTLLHSLIRFEAGSYEEAVFLYQRLPRALIALYTGAVTAPCGLVFQSLFRNPLASGSTLGIHAGASLFVIAGALIWNLGIQQQGIAALTGAMCGFVASAGVARLSGRMHDPKGLSLILGGTLVSMLMAGLSNALLLSDPARRNDYLGWLTGNINHVYFSRLESFWWIGIIALFVLLLLARSMTLLLLGHEKATSVGVPVRLVSITAIVMAVLGSGSAIAVCGPIGFIGLIAPHMIRPLVGNNLSFALPLNIIAGAVICLLSDLVAREAFHPYTVHTGLLTDLIGGLFFIVIVRRFYLLPAKGDPA